MGTPTVTDAPSHLAAPVPTRPASANGGRGLPLRRRWNVPWIALGVFLVVTSALAFAVIGSGTGSTTPVLALARSVQAGEVLVESSLRVVYLSDGAALRTVPAEARRDVIGRAVIAELAAGTVLSPDLVSRSSAVGAGEAVVAVRLEPSAVPAGNFGSGDAVMVVRTPVSTDSPGDGSAPPVVWTARVFGVADVESSAGPVVVVSLVLDALDAPGVAAAAATDEVRLVLVRSLDDVPPELLFTRSDASSAEGPETP
ncbi:MAG: flagellar biosynthesis protein FlgA [Actinobacteria bacterium]|nr:flagellar biosynthesis protein FlgA [Actinomycetota bacterium]